jgi:hypothetical protein
MQKLYESLGLETKKDNLITNLYKIPKKDNRSNMPHFQPIEAGYVIQADLLFMPDDNGYKYALTVVDDGSRKIDLEPLKNKDSETVLKAFKEIFKRGYVTRPKYKLEVDAGSEFKGKVKEYFEQYGVIIRVAQVGRSRQQALVERVNQTIATLLFKRQASQEVLTGEDSKEWIDDLSKIVPLYNKMIEKKKIKQPIDIIDKDPVATGDAVNLLAIGTKVRVALDHPISTATDKRLHGRFRSSDVRWNPQIRTVKQYILKPAQVPLYLLDGNFSRHKVEPVAYSKSQLQVVNKNEIVPEGEKIIRGNPTNYVVEKIVGKKFENRKVMYKVKWLGFKDTTYEPRSTLIKQVPKMINEYELKFAI